MCVYVFIMKTCLYNFDPLKPHFYTVKLGFTGVYITFVISAQKHRLWVPKIYVLSRNMKNIRIFYPKNGQFFMVKFSVYLNRRVFVMFAHNSHKCVCDDTSVHSLLWIHIVVSCKGFLCVCVCVMCHKHITVSVCTAKATHIFSAKKFSISAYHSM